MDQIIPLWVLVTRDRATNEVVLNVNTTNRATTYANWEICGALPIEDEPGEVTVRVPSLNTADLSNRRASIRKSICTKVMP